MVFHYGKFRYSAFPRRLSPLGSFAVGGDEGDGFASLSHMNEIGTPNGQEIIFHKEMTFIKRNRIISLPLQLFGEMSGFIYERKKMWKH